MHLDELTRNLVGRDLPVENSQATHQPEEHRWHVPARVGGQPPWS
jgi:hypothetical protein